MNHEARNFATSQNFAEKPPSAMTIKVYYWPMMIRQASLIRMLEHTGTAYEYISDRAKSEHQASALTA